MPGRRAAATVDTTLCRRCQTSEPVITVRTEPLCAPCFVRYVSTKVVKRMESFRVRNSTSTAGRTLLLPLSFGPSSIVLLHVLSQHLKGQMEKTGRTGFKLHVFHVRYPGESIDAVSLDEVRRLYPEHVYSTGSLCDVLSLEGVRDLLSAGREDGVSGTAHDGSNEDERFNQLLTGLNSATSRADMMQILLRKIVVEAAKTQDCEAILWADSTTRLAERTLAETAKGRGASLPWMVIDGQSLHGTAFYYPMRELLSKEIASFTTLVDPPLSSLLAKVETKPSVSTKNTTIDDLMKQYFESAELEYPSIVANVVRTSGKLQTPSLADVERQCELCDLPLDGKAPEKSRLCYGCIRTLPKS